jgi:hypothetical protein
MPVDTEIAARSVDLTGDVSQRFADRMIVATVAGTEDERARDYS